MTSSEEKLPAGVYLFVCFFDSFSALLLPNSSVHSVCSDVEKNKATEKCEGNKTVQKNDKDSESDKLCVSVCVCASVSA